MELHMLMENKFTLKAPIERVWDIVMRPEVLQEAIPGAEEVLQTDDDVYQCVVKQKVGPIKVKFKFTETIVERVAPTHIRAVGKGADTNKAGSFTQELTVDLTDVGNDEVEVSYRTTVQLVGRLATFGERVMRAKAKEMEEQFTQGLKLALESRA
jgi:carbon monoxide dehydrogenase subunit G